VREALPETGLGQLENIKTLPGMVRAAVNTLEKVWLANIDLSAASHPRLQALAALELNVLRRLPPSMKKPKALVDLASARIAHAPVVLGPIEIHGHSEMPVCWRGLVPALAEVVPVTWIAGPRSVPDWLDGKRIEIRRTQPNDAILDLYSCATPQHEILEAFRWMRALIADGKARPEDIAIAAASPVDFDDLVLALSEDSNLPIHFVQGIKAVATAEGQTAAALADVLVKGLSQERVRRLLRRLHGIPSLADLPHDWARILPTDAPLATIQRWEQAFARTTPSDWPEGVDRSGLILRILHMVEKGPEVAREVGEDLLPRLAHKLWERALEEGPPAALPVTLTHLRIDDKLDPASHPIWTSAISLAAAPRPFARLVALNAGRWPRRISEDRLIPDHIIPIKDLDPLPVADADRRDFATILASANHAATRAVADARDTLALGALLRGPLIGISEVELLDISEGLPLDPNYPDRTPQLTLWTELVPVTAFEVSAVFRVLLEGVDGDDRLVEIVKGVVVRGDAVADPLNPDGIQSDKRDGEARPKLLLELGEHAFHRTDEDAFATTATDEFGQQNSSLDGFAQTYGVRQQNALARLP